MVSTRSRAFSWIFATALVASCGAAGTTRVSAGENDTPDSTRVDDDDPTTTSTSSAIATSSTSSSTSSTSSTSTTSLAPTTRTTAAGPTTVEFNGRHEGTEHFGVDTRRCAFLDHHLDEVFTLTDGTPWVFTSVYCGTIDANSVWSGTGTFTLTSPTGDTLTGRSTSQAKIPSQGVPYHLDIKSGTGQFNGAHGDCTVDEHLVPNVFGVQQHSGSFTCTLTVPAGAAG